MAILSLYVITILLFFLNVEKNVVMILSFILDVDSMAQDILEHLATVQVHKMVAFKNVQLFAF